MILFLDLSRRAFRRCGPSPPTTAWRAATDGHPRPGRRGQTLPPPAAPTSGLQQARPEDHLDQFRGKDTTREDSLVADHDLPEPPNKRAGCRQHHPHPHGTGGRASPPRAARGVGPTRPEYSPNKQRPLRALGSKHTAQQSQGLSRALGASPGPGVLSYSGNFKKTTAKNRQLT